MLNSCTPKNPLTFCFSHHTGLVVASGIFGAYDALEATRFRQLFNYSANTVWSPVPDKQLCARYECHESPFPLTGLPFLKAFETDLLPLAPDFDNIDIAVRRKILSTTSTDGMLS